MSPPTGAPRWQALLLLALAAFAARLIPVAVLGPERYATRGYLYYEEMADNVLAGRGLHRTMPFGQGDRFAIRTPGYPLVVAGLKALPGDLTGKVALFGAACGTASVLLLLRIASRLFGDAPGRLAAWLLALWPAAVVHDAAMQDTALYTALLLASVLATLILRDRAGPRAAIAWGVLAALAILVRVTLVPPLLALLAWAAWSSLATVRRRVACAGLAAAVAIAGLSPWLARNARVVGAPVLTSDAGRSLWLGHNPQTFSVYPRASIDRSEERAWAALSDEQRAHVRSLAHDELAQDAWFRTEALRFVRERPLHAAAGAVRKLAATFSPWMSPRAGPLKQGVHLLAWGAALALALVAAWRLRARLPELAPAWLPIVLLAAHSAVFFGHSSYRAYADALALAFASATLAGALPRLRGRAGVASAFASFLAALSVRLGLILLAGTLHPPQQAWQRGYEIGAVARSLAEGRGFSDPFLAPTGPTAAVGPGMPLLLAPAWRALGPDSPASWRVFVLLNALSSALVAPALLALGWALRLRPRVVLVVAAAWAIEPVAALSVLGWNGHAFVLLATLGVAACVALERLRLRESGTRLVAATVAAGVIVGAGLWFEPLLLPALLAWSALALRGVRSRPVAALAPAAALALALVVIAPWILRNAVVVGTASVRSWAGPELFLGAQAGPWEPTPAHLTPMRDPAEMARLREAGERAYVAEKLRQARDAIAERPARWVAACASRYVVFWAGRASWWRPAPDHPLRAGPAGAARGAWHLATFVLAAAGLLRHARGRPGAALVALVLALYPLTYALTHVEARYRLPLLPLLLTCAVLAFVRRDRAFVDDRATAEHDAA